MRVRFFTESLSARDKRIAKSQIGVSCTRQDNMELCNLISVQQNATYSVYYISVGNSTCFGCWHPSSGARTTVITASGTGQTGLLTSALVAELELIHVYRTVGTVGTVPTDVYRTVGTYKHWVWRARTGMLWLGDKWRAVVNVVMKLGSINCGEFLD